MNRPATSLAVRADGDARIGFGHVMRCAALAQALLDVGHPIIWFSHTPQAVPAQLAARIEIRPMPADREEAAVLLASMQQDKLCGLIADWQITDPDLCRQLRQSGIWLALIGNHLGGAEADLVIRQHFGAASPGAPDNMCDGSEHILLAPRYADLPPRTVRPQVKRLLISLGGSETPILDRVLAALDGMAGLEGVELEVRRATPRLMAPPGTGLLEALKAADLAILGAGTTLHEAAATGLAVIAVPIAANQLERALQFQALALGVSVNPADDGFDLALQQAVDALMSDPTGRQAYALAGQAAVDGHGASRVANRISDLVSPALCAPNASISTTKTGLAP